MTATTAKHFLEPFYNLRVSPGSVHAALPLAGLVPALSGWFQPAAISAAYVFGVVVFNRGRPRPPPAEGSLAARAIAAASFVHNMVLFFFSLACFTGLFPSLVRHMFPEPSVVKYCDRENLLWESALGYWAWLFYLSKYYEFLDTAIILSRGRRSSTLQTYHHVGAVFCLHVGFYTESSTLAYFIAYNSFIHTIMYLYFACTSLGIRPPVRKAITTMQIMQFVCGITIGLSVLVLHTVTGNKCLKNNADWWALVYNLAYLMPLLYLFCGFFVSSYKNMRLRAPTQQSKRKAQ